MMETTGNAMNVQIIKADKDRIDVIRNLVHFYIYDLSEVMGWDCPENGLFGGCDDLPQYWAKMPDDPKYAWPSGWKGYPFIIKVDDKIAGFALARKLGAEAVYEMGDFFILRKYRSKGVGKYVACSIFDAFAGKWRVAQMVGNTPAQAFWSRVIDGYTNGNHQECNDFDEIHGVELSVIYFNSVCR
ncbi:GNAT family N-acetyltransferase [bacterium]|nr:GNAT family N-acetyltransferase [bacterium]